MGPTTYQLLPTIPTTYYLLLPTTYYLLPTTYYLLPGTRLHFNFKTLTLTQIQCTGGHPRQGVIATVQFFFRYPIRPMPRITTSRQEIIEQSSSSSSSSSVLRPPPSSVLRPPPPTSTTSSYS